MQRTIARVDDVTADVVASFLAAHAWRRACSYNQLLGVLRRLFDWLVLQEILPRSALRATSRRVTDRRLPYLFDAATARRLLDLAARSLMHDPALLLIDEPTAGVEPRVAAVIYETIKGLAAQGKAVLLVDQNIKRALEIADYIYVMRTGTMLSEGSRAAFGGDVEALVSRWLYASG